MHVISLRIHQIISNTFSTFFPLREAFFTAAWYLVLGFAFFAGEPPWLCSEGVFLHHSVQFKLPPTHV